MLLPVHGRTRLEPGCSGSGCRCRTQRVPATAAIEYLPRTLSDSSKESFPGHAQPTPTPAPGPAAGPCYTELAQGRTGPWPCYIELAQGSAAVLRRNYNTGPWPWSGTDFLVLLRLSKNQPWALPLLAVFVFALQFCLRSCLPCTERCEHIIRTYLQQRVCCEKSSSSSSSSS